MARTAWVLLSVLTTWACPADGGAGTTPQELSGVCAPVVTRSGQPFSFTVTGGCTGTISDYRCVVNKGTGTLEVTLLGPQPCSGCTCVAEEHPCAGPALEEGRWRVSFIRNERFDRDVDAHPQAPVFECARPDAGSVDGG